jgi:transposase
VIEQFRIDQGPAGVAAPIECALRIEPDPAEVRVVLETRHGLLVEALIDAGFTVVPVDPDLVARRRGPARKKDDAEDARICCLLALDRHAALETLIPHGEIGGHITRLDHPPGVQCYAGSTPVTRRSGKSDFVVARRLAHDHHLGAAVHQRAFCSLLRSEWAREFYDSKTAAGKSHHAALRALSNRWLEILWHCLTKGVLYDETVHVANRNRALGHAA